MKEIIIYVLFVLSVVILSIAVVELIKKAEKRAKQKEEEAEDGSVKTLDLSDLEAGVIEIEGRRFYIVKDRWSNSLAMWPVGESTQKEIE